MLLTWIVLPMVIAMTAAASSIDDIELQPLSKWVHCIDDGRLDIKWEVHGEEKLQSGLALPDYAEVHTADPDSDSGLLLSAPSRTGVQ